MLTSKLSGKKGAAFTLRDEGMHGSWVENLPKVVALRPFWNYSWGSNYLTLQPDSIEFLPMIWGYWQHERFRDEISCINRQNPILVLPFNEPDSKEQSNISVGKVIELWPELEALKIHLVSPSCVNPLGQWMESFMEQANDNNLRVDIIGIHSYMGPDTLAFQKKLRSIYEKYNRPLLITEFAVADWHAKTKQENRFTPKQVLRFMNEALPWLEEQDWIVGYSWFSFDFDSVSGSCSALFDENGNLTACGRYYAEFKPNLKLLNHYLEKKHF